MHFELNLALDNNFFIFSPIDFRFFGSIISEVTEVIEVSKVGCIDLRRLEETFCVGISRKLTVRFIDLVVIFRL